MQGSPQGRSNNSQHLLSASCVQAVPVIPVVPSANLVGAGTLPGRKAPGQVLESGPGPVTKGRGGNTWGGPLCASSTPVPCLLGTWWVTFPAPENSTCFGGEILPVLSDDRIWRWCLFQGGPGDRWHTAEPWRTPPLSVAESEPLSV